MEIFVEQMHNALAVPLASIYSHGRDSYVFARRGEDVEPVKVQIGNTSETHATVAQGLATGQDVLILAAGQGRQLLERAGIDTSEALAGGDGGPGAAEPGPAPRNLKLDKGKSRPGRQGEVAGPKATAGAVSTKGGPTEVRSPEKQAPVAAAGPALRTPPAASTAPAAPTGDGARVAPATGNAPAPAKPLPSPVSAVDTTH